MNKLFFISATSATFFLLACNGNGNEYDASGTFEADEVIVSSLANGKILSFNVEEGISLAKDSIVGLVDPTGLALQKEEVEATIECTWTNKQRM